jgi:hypothetical protein
MLPKVSVCHWPGPYRDRKVSWWRWFASLNAVSLLAAGEMSASAAAWPVLNEDEIWAALLTHSRALWGAVCSETAEANFQALRFGGELRSAFHTDKGVHRTVVTNAERTRTWPELDPGGQCLALASPSKDGLSGNP